MTWWKFWDDARDRGDERPDYYEEGVHLARQERYHDALTSFRLALKETPDDVAAIEQIAVLNTRIGLSDEAVKMYERALELSPDSASAHYGIAFLLLNQGQQESAAAHLERFLEAEKPGGTEIEQRVDHACATLDRLRAGTDEGA
jgi:tetratricopeptide (TPR) repeat protein